MPLRGVVGAVLHHLLGRDVERHAHAIDRALTSAAIDSNTRGQLVVGDALPSRRVIVAIDRVDAAQRVGPAGGRVGVGRLPQRLAGQGDALVAAQVRRGSRA